MRKDVPMIVVTSEGEQRFPWSRHKESWSRFFKRILRDWGPMAISLGALVVSIIAVLTR